MIEYCGSLEGFQPEQFDGFCVGWHRPLDGPALHRVLAGSAHVVVAVEDDRVVGFINALSDGCLMAYIPLLEVRPEFQGRGIGTELVRRMQSKLAHLYGIDILCDDDVVPFYERLGFQQVRGMCVRNFDAELLRR